MMHITEGGNYQIDGVGSEPVDISKNSRNVIVANLVKLFTDINNRYYEKNKQYIWKDIAIKGNFTAGSGSAAHLFDTAIDTATLTLTKPKFGDIDVMIPEELLVGFDDFLKSTSIISTDFSYIGSKNTAGQVITLWKSKMLGHNVQVDFEGVPFDSAGKPTEFSKFVHSSAIDDLKAGIKGVFHKYILRALTYTHGFKGLIKSPAGKTTKEGYVSPLIFSVQYGMRAKHVNNSDGTYSELKPSESVYERNLVTIFTKLFKLNSASKEDMVLFGSYKGILELINKYLSTSDKGLVFAAFTAMLYGKGAQTLYANDIARDIAEKATAYDTFTKAVTGIDTKEMDAMKDSYATEKLGGKNG